MYDRETLPPRVVIVMADQWRRALLRAALRDVGYDAVGTRGVREAAAVRPLAPHRGSVRLILLDQEALGAESSLPGLLSLRERLGAPEAVLLARATVATPDGPWREVLRRPFTIGDVVQSVQRVVPLTTNLQHPIDEDEDDE